MVSAIFHYLGPSLAVLLFARIAAPGVLWLRIAAAAAVFAVWRRPWRLAGRLDRRQLVTLLALGGVLAGMNALFYLAVARLPLALCVGGVAVLTAIQAGASPLAWSSRSATAPASCSTSMLGHRVANTRVSDVFGGIDQLGAAGHVRADARLLPAVAVVVGAVVLHQIPSVRELAGIALVIAGIAVHQADTT